MTRKRVASRRPKRLGRPINRLPMPVGSYIEGINQKIAASIGLAIVHYSHLEEDMIPFLSDLLGDVEVRVTRPLFYSLFGANGRSKVMRSLLENSSINKEKDSEYDWVLNQFDEISIKRNKIAHCLWFVHAETKEHYAVSPNGGDFGIPLSGGGEKWTEEDFSALMLQMHFLRQKVRALHKDSVSRRG